MARAPSRSTRFNEAVVRRRRRASLESRCCPVIALALQRSRRPKTTESRLRVELADVDPLASTKPSSEDDGECPSSGAAPAARTRFNEAVVRRRRRAQLSARALTGRLMLQRSRRPKTTESRLGAHRAPDVAPSASTKPSSEDDGEGADDRMTTTETACFNEAVVRRRRRGRPSGPSWDRCDGRFNEAVVRRRRRAARRPCGASFSVTLQRSRRPKTTERRTSLSTSSALPRCFNEAVVRRRRRVAAVAMTGKCSRNASTKPSSEDDGEHSGSWRISQLPGSFNEAVVRRRRRVARAPPRAVRVVHASTKPSSEDDGERFDQSLQRPTRAGFNEAVVRRRRRVFNASPLARKVVVLQRSRRPKTTERGACEGHQVAPAGALQRSRRPKTTESNCASSFGKCPTMCFNEAVVRRRRRGSRSGHRRARVSRFNEAVVRRRRRGPRSLRTRLATPQLQRSRRPKTTESIMWAICRGVMWGRFNEAVVRRRRRAASLGRLPIVDDVASTKPSSEDDGETFVPRCHRLERHMLQRSRRPKTTERFSVFGAFNAVEVASTKPSSEDDGEVGGEKGDGGSPGRLQRSRRPKTTESPRRASRRPRATRRFNEAVVRRRRRG